MMEPFDRLCEFLKTDNKVEEVSTKFSSFKRDDERVSFAMELLRQYNIFTLPLYMNENQKSDTKAAEYRKLGNRAYQQKDDIKALALYNRCIALSQIVQLEDIDRGNHELSLGFANRSAVSFLLGDNASCLNDIDLAFKYGYPADLHYKLLERKGKCFLIMNRFEDALETFTGAVKALELTSLPAEKCNALKKQIKELQEKANSRNVAIEKPYRFNLQRKLPVKTYLESNEIVCASDAVEIKYSQDMGRHIQASKDLNPGDVIAVESPYASVLLEDAYYTHCYNCLLRCNALIPCETCSTVMFCSDKCLSEAKEKNHSIDCSLLPPLASYRTDKMGMLAVRIILTASAYGKKLNDLISEIQSYEMETSVNERMKGFSKNGKYNSDEYTTIYHLVFDNYGYHYATHSLQERQSHLGSQYFFICNCEPCSGSWPLYDSLPCEELLLKCSHCGASLENNVLTKSSDGKLVTCAMCKGVNDVTKRKKVLMELTDQFKQNILSVLRGHTEGVATDLVAHLRLLHENVQRPWKEYNDCQEALKQCFNFAGNCYIV